MPCFEQHISREEYKIMDDGDGDYGDRIGSDGDGDGGGDGDGDGDGTVGTFISDNKATPLATSAKLRRFGVVMATEALIFTDWHMLQ